MDQIEGDIPLSGDSCVSTKCTTRSTCSLTAQDTVLTSNITQSMLLARGPIIILDNSIFMNFLGQATTVRNFCSNQPVTNLLSRPPEITVLPEQSIGNLSSHLQVKPRSATASRAPLAIASTAHSSDLLFTGKETTAEIDDCLALSEEQTQSSPEVLVVPDSPQYDTGITASQSDSQTLVEEKTQTSLQKIFPGEKILNTLASTIMSLSEQHSIVKDSTPPTPKQPKPTNAKLQLNLSQLDLKPLSIPQSSQCVAQISFKAEQLTEESDEELELPVLAKEETTLCVYNTTHSTQEECVSPGLGSVGSGVSDVVEPELTKMTSTELTHQSDSIRENETAPHHDSQLGGVVSAEWDTVAVAGAKSADFDEYEEPSAKRQRIETPNSSLHGQLISDCNLPFFHTAMEYRETLTPLNHTASLPETTPAYPHEPTTLADEGLATLDQALPMECAREHALVPNLPRCAHQRNEDLDNSDSEDEGESGIPIVGLPEQAHLPDDSQEGNISEHQTDLRVETAAFEHQMVPDLSLDTLFSSKSLYQEEQSESLKDDSRDGSMTTLEDDFESNSNSSLLDFALKAMESRKSTATQTVSTTPDQDHFPEDGLYNVHPKTPFNKHSSFSFKNDQGPLSEFCTTTRLNLSKPRLRLGLSRKARTNCHK